MATSSSYYLNAPSLGSATAVFTDAALSECAPNGFYSNGVIVREQVGCVLLPQQNCPTCPPPISLTINMNVDTYWACQELIEYTLNVQLSSGATNVCDTTILIGDFASLGWGSGQNFYVQIAGPGYRHFIVEVGATSAIPVASCTSCFPVSYNCIEGTCTDPGDGTGTYATLGECEAVCGVPPPVSYNCISGNCVDPGDGTGTYATLVACEAACFAVSYNCVEGTCTDPGDGTGTYATLVACEAACSPPPPVSYNCVSGNCTDPGDGTGTYATLVACEAACAPPPCDCHDGVINDNNSFNYTDCNGVLQSGSIELGSEICFDITKAYSGNITDNGPSVFCTCT